MKNILLMSNSSNIFLHSSDQTGGFDDVSQSLTSDRTADSEDSDRGDKVSVHLKDVYERLKSHFCLFCTAKDL